MLTKREIACLAYGVLCGLRESKLMSLHESNLKFLARCNELGMTFDEIDILVQELKTYSDFLGKISDKDMI